MTDDRYQALALRVDGLARVLMRLIADMEIRESLDGNRFCRDLRQYADGRRRHPGLETSALAIKAIADELDEAREARARIPQK